MHLSEEHTCILFHIKKFRSRVYIENVSLRLHSSANLSKNVPHIEGHPKDRNLLEPWVQITNVFGQLSVKVQIISEVF